MSKAEKTRREILEAGFDLMYQHAYQGMSFDKVLEQLKVEKGLVLTKGALYHHFKNKEQLGLAVINEIIYPRIRKTLIDPLDTPGPAIQVLLETLRSSLLNISEVQIKYGCPTNNLIQEMAPLNENFAKALSRIIISWKAKLISLLARAADAGEIQTLDLEETAQFIIASYEGTRGLGKLYKSKNYYEAYLKQLEAYLENV